MTSSKITFLGVDGAKALQKILAGDSPSLQPEVPKVIVPNSSVSSRDYLLLEARSHGSYSYPDVLVAKQTLYQGKNWNEAHEELRNTNQSMLTLRQFVDFLNLLRSGKAYDGSGSLVSAAELDQIYREITEVRSPYRAEWLDARFEKKGKLWRIHHGSTSDPLEECLMKDRNPGISLEDWLQHANEQGLPQPKVKKGDLWYWHPQEGRVAWFNANSGRVYLFCNEDPQYANSALGVRPVVSAGGAKKL